MTRDMSSIKAITADETSSLYMMKKMHSDKSDQNLTSLGNCKSIVKNTLMKISQRKKSNKKSDRVNADQKECSRITQRKSLF